MMDDYSRAIMGYELSLMAPSALKTALALRQAIWRKKEPYWPMCGIPATLYTDRVRRMYYLKKGKFAVQSCYRYM